MLRDPKVLLEDIRLAAADVEEFTRGRTLDDFKTNELLRSAVERKFIVIGEALVRLEKLDAEWANKLMDFRKIVGFRNVLVHGYEMIDDAITRLGLSPLARIPDRTAVEQADVSRTPIAIAVPDSPVALAYEKLAEHLEHQALIA